VATITSQQPALTSSTSATFAFSADEAGVSFSCQLDGAPPEPCSSPKTYPALSGGSHTFSVTPTDAAGNVGVRKTSSWTIDLTVPNVTITARPPAVTSSTSASFSFTADKAPVSFTCALDGGAPVACTSPYGFGKVSQGKHAFVVAAKDEVGHVGQTSYGWTVDTTPPTTTITGKPDKVTYNSSATFTFSANEQPVTFACQLDNTPPTACSGSKTYTGLAGNHTFVVRATDAAGNVETPGAGYSWTVEVIG
jgi:hypothetical protein